MKVGIPTWNGRISPVFDVARRLLVADIEDGKEIGREERAIEEMQPALRAKRLLDLGVSVLVCGAVSGSLEQMLLSSGVRVIPQICGLVEDVLQAFVADRLTEEAFLLPGCCGCGRRRRGRHRGGGSGVGKQGDAT